MQTVRFAIQYWKDQKQSIYFKETEKSEQMVDQMVETQLRDKHIRRLSMRECSSTSWCDLFGCDQLFRTSQAIMR